MPSSLYSPIRMTAFVRPEHLDIIVVSGPTLVHSLTLLPGPSLTIRRISELSSVPHEVLSAQRSVIRLDRHSNLLSDVVMNDDGNLWVIAWLKTVIELNGILWRTRPWCLLCRRATSRVVATGKCTAPRSLLLSPYSGCSGGVLASPSTAELSLSIQWRVT